MENYINKENAFADSPRPSKEWQSASEEKRISRIFEMLKTNKLYKDFQIVKADNNGRVEIKIDKTIPTNVRGVMLLELEEMLKTSVDQSITLWLVPVGDKSKLRNLRGIKIK